mgnify:CR=1 FL=1
MSNLRAFGGYAAIYMGAAYAVAIVIFLVVLDYPSMVNPADKVGLLARSGGMIWAVLEREPNTLTPVLVVFSRLS